MGTQIPAFVPVSFDEAGNEDGYIAVRQATGSQLKAAVKEKSKETWLRDLRRLLTAFRDAGGTNTDRVGDVLKLS